MRFIFLIYLIFGLTPHIHGGVIQETLDILQTINHVTKAILKAVNTIESIPVAEITAGSLIYSRQNQLLDKMAEVSARIVELEKQQERNTDLTIQMLRNMWDKTELLLQIDRLNVVTTLINLRYNQLGDYERHRDALEPITLLKFTQWNVDPSPNSLLTQVEQLHGSLYGCEPYAGADKLDYSQTLIWRLTQRFQDSPEQMCLAKQSAQQFAYKLFSKAAVTELKAYFMMEFSWMVQRKMGRGNFTQELLLMRTNHQKRLDAAVEILQDVMNKSDRIYWRCDPEKNKHVEGETYDRVTRLLQGFVENEINLHSDQSCWNTCDDYHDTRSNGCYQPEQELCGQQPSCNGRLYNCGLIDSDMTICPAQENGTRRYEYIHYDDGTTLGGKSAGCKSKEKKADSWTRWLVMRCHYCFCLCDEPGPLSDRYFNLRASMSDFMRNRIVTGVRFVKSQRVFHLQLQQGQLLSYGAINSSTLEWLPLDDYNVSDADIRNDYDYHTLSADSRSLDLDEIVSNATDQVVTGVRFRIFKKHLNLEVRFTPFNFSTGLLVEPQTKSFWLGNHNTDLDGARQKLILKESDLPTASEMPSLPLSQTNQYMEFVSSSREKDVAQNTLPFIDIQEVVPHPAVPLSGLGIYHKGRSGYGGFFAPKVVTYDFAKHLTEPRK
ncbi:uncharacterized protein [Drosophila bipectinata]|uniref:uncharacterized protein n=1 Tax=Drosophila bipectinata TaxID=42026 RepID=UPI001C8928BB|nr:uncharacterized protein LOC108125172 [Drosophila bipectinata]